MHATLLTAGLGALIGLALALAPTGASGGIPALPLPILALHLSVTVATASDLMLWPVAIPLAVRSSIGMLLGSRLAGRASPSGFKQTCGVMSLPAADVMVMRTTSAR